MSEELSRKRKPHKAVWRIFFLAAEASNLWQGADFYFFYVTFYDSLFRLRVFMWQFSFWRAHTRGPLYFYRLLIAIFVLIMAQSLMREEFALFDSELLSGDHELLEEAGSTPPEFTQSQSAHGFCMSEIHLFSGEKADGHSRIKWNKYSNCVQSKSFIVFQLSWPTHPQTSGKSMSLGNRTRSLVSHLLSVSSRWRLRVYWMFISRFTSPL